MSREAIKQFQHASRTLDLDGVARSDLFEQIGQYASQFLDGLGTTPAYTTPLEPGNFAKAAAITDEGIDIEHVLDLLSQHVDSVGINTTSGRFVGFIPVY